MAPWFPTPLSYHTATPIAMYFRPSPNVLNTQMQITNHSITPKNISLVCKRIGNKVIVEIVGGYQAFSRTVLIGWTNDVPIVYDSNCIRFIDGSSGVCLAVGYAVVQTNTEIIIKFDRDLSASGHIQGGFSYYI